MGCFDTVLIPCPVCGVKEKVQSKSGDCSLANYEIGEVPNDVLKDVFDQAPFVCTHCGTSFSLGTTIITEIDEP